MATTTTNIPTLKINYLTKAQYDTALANNEINENELYFTEIPNNAEYLFLTGGNVTGPTSFGDSVNIDELTVGDLVVNGKLTADTIDTGLFSGGPVSSTTMTGAFNTTIYFTKRNGIVNLTCVSNASANLVKSSWNTVVTIPEAYRPYHSNTIMFMGIENNTRLAAKQPLEFRINSAGELSVYGAEDAPDNNQLFCVVSYVGPANTTEDAQALIDIPEYESSGSVDEDLYNAINGLGWTSNVIE